MTETDVKLGLNFRWWVKPCVFALVITNRLLNRLAEKGTEVVQTKGNRQAVIVALHNQGSDIGVRGVLFIDWDDGVTTALESNEWTWSYYKNLQKYKKEAKPIYRIGHTVGTPLNI